MFLTKIIPKFTDNGVKSVAYTSGFRHFVFSVHADATTTATIRIKGSTSQEAPDFSASASSTNDWGYIAFRELETADLKAGSTGIALSAATLHKIYEVECNALTHVAFDVSSFSGDGVSITALIQEDGN